MAGPLTLRLLTREGVAHETDAVSIIAPGELGYLGILRHHAPLVTTLKPGTLSWRTSWQRAPSTARIGAGLLEVVRDQVTILTEALTISPSPTESAHVR